MPTAVFDFNETLVYLPSILIWSRKIPFQKKVLLPFGFIVEKLFGIPWYPENVLECLRGKDLLRTIERMKNLPSVPGGVTYFRSLSDRGYKITVMSYSPGVFVNSWLSANRLEAQLICPNLVISDGVVQDISKDPVTKIYTEEPNCAKAIVLAKMNIRPDICVGDDERRDRVCDQYVNIRELEPNYKNKFQLAFQDIDKFLFANR